MSWYELTVIIHLVGAAIGVGAATSSDWLFLHSIRDRVVTREQFSFLTKISHLVRIGLAIVILSGVAIVLQNPSVFVYPSFRAKMILVFLLTVNGLFFHGWLLEFLKRHRNERLTNAMLANRLWFFAGAGAISIASWYGALLIGAMEPLESSLWLILAVYLVVVGGAAGMAYLTLSHLIFSPIIDLDLEPPDLLSADGKLAERSPFLSPGNLQLLALLVIFVGGLAFAFFRT